MLSNEAMVQYKGFITFTIFCNEAILAARLNAGIPV